MEIVEADLKVVPYISACSNLTVVKHVAARPRVGGEVCLEEVADVHTVDDARRSLHMTLDVVRESDGRHS